MKSDAEYYEAMRDLAREAVAQWNASIARYPLFFALGLVAGFALGFLLGGAA